MIDEIVLATGNKGKVKEFEGLLHGIAVRIIGLGDLESPPEVVEVRTDKPITTLRCVARRSDGTEVLRGTCIVYTMQPVDLVV